jgi:hypothetical protein
VVRKQIEERLATLRQEYDAGRRMLAELEARQAELQQTLLRIGGAVQVLEELLGGDDPPDGEPADGASPVDGRVPAATGSG